MSNPDGVNPKAAKPAKPQFGTYLKAVETERLNAANESAQQKPLLLQRRIDKKTDERTINTRLLQATGLLVSAIWLAGAAFYIQRTVGWNNVSSLMPHELGGFMAGILSPIALFWMIAAFVLRSNDVKMYAEALREEVQAMIFPSDEANRKVNNDIERLMRQTAEMGRATKVILNTIQTARDGLRGEIQALNASSQETMQRLGKMGESISERTRDVIVVSDKLEETIQNIENGTLATNKWMEKLKVANQQIGQQTAMVDKSTQNTEAAVARLSTLLRERLESLGSLHKDTEDALKNAATEIANQRDLLRTEAIGIEEKSRGVAAALQKGVGHLYQFTDDATDKAKLIETRLQGHAATIEHTLKLTTETAQQMEMKTMDAVIRLDQANTRAKTGAEQVETILSSSTEKLVEATLRMAKDAQDSLGNSTNRMIDEVDRVSNRAQEISSNILTEVSRKIVDTSSAFGYIQNQIQALATLFDQRKKHLDEAGEGARNTAANLQQSLQVALDKVRDTSDALQHSVATIDTSVQAAERAHTNITGLHDQLHTKGQDMALLAGKIAGQLQTVGTELDTQNNNLNNQVAKSVQSLQDLTTMQDELVENLNKVDQQSQKTAQQIQDLKNYHIALSEDAALSDKALGQLSDRLVFISSDTVNKIKSTLDNMTLLEADYHRLSDAGINDIGRVTDAYRQSLDNVQDGYKRFTAEGADDAGRLTQSFRQSLDDVRAEYERLIAGGAEDANRLTDVYRQGLNDIRAGYDQFSAANVNDLECIEQSYRNTLESVQGQAGKANDNLVQAQQTLQNTIADASQIAENAVGKITESVTGLKAIANDMDMTSDHTLSKISRVQDWAQTIQTNLRNLHKATDTFEAKATQNNAAMTGHVQLAEQAVSAMSAQNDKLAQQSQAHVSGLQQNVSQLDDITARLHDYMNQFKGGSDEIDSRLAQSVATLLDQGRQVDEAAERVIGKIGNVGTELRQQEQQIKATSDQAVSRLLSATQQIGDKALALEAATQLVQQQTEELRTQDAKQKRDTFFNSTKFVVESLHSLALDFTRLLEGELPEKTWKAYQKGDTGSFTRRLLTARDEETQNRIKTKFAEDHEFRTYAQRYLRQFEEIYDQAAATDHADMLASVFNTSDVGKLYKFLCSTLDRDARGDTNKQAA